MAQKKAKNVSVDKRLPHKEIRFAVVMYGGVSLAIYIHGVAQELLSLVRATARNKIDGKFLIPENELKGAELVYRCLGDALRAKFVVDILSGTSAGGINAVYLAKALVNNRSMEGLKDLWVREGDIAKLINDDASLEGLSGLRLKDPPDALLNSQRMYSKLLEALKQMGSAKQGEASPFVDELDLSITATDIRGLNLPITIRNNRINELRYKTVFRFNYSTTKKITNERITVDDVVRNDFTKDKDPFLAFAARCTSSIPPAFEAMQLKDIEPIVGSRDFRDYYKEVLKSDTEAWRHLYGEYATEDNFPIRSFGDGGYLDNKPFSYAIETLIRRRADLPVDRKLVYIEPSPEHPEDRASSEERPDMIKNILAALVELPRQETIREDLKSILERNEIIGRTNKILVGVNNLFYSVSKNLLENWERDKSDDWREQYLDQIITPYGPHYAAYHQLRVESVLDNLSSMLACSMRWDENGEDAKQLRRVLNLWRRVHYRIISKDSEAKTQYCADVEIHSENEILYRFDIEWRQRRMFFIQELANVLLHSLDGDEAEKRQAEILQDLSSTDWSDAVGSPDDFRRAIQELKEKLNLISIEFNQKVNALRISPLTMPEKPDKELKSYVENAQALRERWLGLIDLEEVIRDFEASEKRTSKLPENLCATIRQIEELTAALYPYKTEEASGGQYLMAALRLLSEQTKAALGIKSKVGAGETTYLTKAAQMDLRQPLAPEIRTPVYKEVQKCLSFFYDLFEFYDMLMFPLRFGTNFGESDEVEIVRISPEDATKFVNERQTGRKKLAGTKLSNFGAFFKQEWRENDMLWGRLDAAEIFIKELLAGGDPSAEAALRDCLWTRLSELENNQYTTPDMIDPYGLAFELILTEDLKPPLQSLAYKIVDEGHVDDVTDREQASWNGRGKDDSPHFQELRMKDAALRRLEGELDGFLLDKKDPGLEEQLARIRKQREQMNQEIEQEIARLRQAKRDKDKAQDQGAWKNFQGGVKRVVRSIAGGAQSKSAEQARYQELLRSVTAGRSLLHYFRYGYRVSPEFELESTVQVASRSARTITRLLRGLSESYPIQRPVGILSLVLQIAMGVVNLLLPKSALNFLFLGYWVWLLYIAEVLIWLGGILTANPALTNVGTTALVITAVLHFLVFEINQFIIGSVRKKRAALILAVVSIIIGAIGYWLAIPLIFNFAVILLLVVGSISLASYAFRHPDAARLQSWLVTAVLLFSVLSVLALGLIGANVISAAGPITDVLRQVVTFLFDIPRFAIFVAGTLLLSAAVDFVNRMLSSSK